MMLSGAAGQSSLVPLTGSAGMVTADLCKISAGSKRMSDGWCETSPSPYLYSQDLAQVNADI